MSARHTLEDRRQRKPRRLRQPQSIRFRMNVVVGGGHRESERQKAAAEVQRIRGHLPTARQWNASNVPRLYVRSWDARGNELRPKRTAFRNVIDKDGKHV